MIPVGNAPDCLTKSLLAIISPPSSAAQMGGASFI